MKKVNKKGQIWDTLIPWIIAAAFLVLILIVYLIISGKATGMVTYFKNLVRFGK